MKTIDIGNNCQSVTLNCAEGIMRWQVHIYPADNREAVTMHDCSSLFGIYNKNGVKMWYGSTYTSPLYAIDNQFHVFLVGRDLVRLKRMPPAVRRRLSDLKEIYAQFKTLVKSASSVVHTSWYTYLIINEKRRRVGCNLAWTELLNAKLITDSGKVTWNEQSAQKLFCERIQHIERELSK